MNFSFYSEVIKQMGDPGNSEQHGNHGFRHFIHKKTVASLLFTLAILVTTALVPKSVAAAEREPLRRLVITAAVDPAYQLQPAWLERLQQEIASVSKVYQREFGITWELGDVIKWTPNDNGIVRTKNLLDVMVADVPRGTGDVLIGFYATRCLDTFAGMSNPFQGEVVIVSPCLSKSKRGETEDMIVAHELAHLFGAFHVRSHIRSLMNGDGIDIFDSQTVRAINLSRDIDFKKGPQAILGLDENKRRQLKEIYNEGHAYGEASPLALGLHFASESLAKQGNWEQALKLAEEILALDKRMYVAYRLRGDWHRMNGRDREAEQAYRQALEIFPDDLLSLAGLGTVLTNQGRNQEASSILSKTLTGGNENWVVAKHNRAVANLNQGKLREAETELREVIKSEPNEIMAYINLAAALGMQHKLEESVTVLQQALQLDPNHFMAHANLGYSLAQMGKWDDAISEYRTALKLQPNNARIKANLQNALLKRVK